MNTSLMLSIVVPDNWMGMLIWYGLLIVCIVLFVIVRKNRKRKDRNVLLEDGINEMEDIKKLLNGERAISKKKLYSIFIQLNLLKDHCKTTYESSQFTVYDNSAKLIEKIFTNLKNINYKKWKDEKTVLKRDETFKMCENVISYLKQAM